jgi:hypothetical protein
LLKGPSLLKGCPQSTQGASSSHRAEKFTKAKSETKHASCATFLNKKRNICCIVSIGWWDTLSDLIVVNVLYRNVVEWGTSHIIQR